MGQHQDTVQYNHLAASAWVSIKIRSMPASRYGKVSDGETSAYLFASRALYSIATSTFLSSQISW
jgi:hypothetical protein